MKPEYVIIHGTNGEGYSEPTIKRTASFDEVTKYISDVFKGRIPVIGGNSPHLCASFHETNEAGDTERISLFTIGKKDKALVLVKALTTTFSIILYSKKKDARSELKNYKKMIVDLNEGSTKDLASGEGDDGYYHFEIV